jgi:hypothetical protein
MEQDVLGQRIRLPWRFNAKLGVHAASVVGLGIAVVG